ncbi:hypothetical protein BGX31_010130 [Mortierella sp. GBA43]|nr:hypothetical protein BGX31_010130 [Mortierella sp. GBA43]
MNSYPIDHNTLAEHPEEITEANGSDVIKFFAENDYEMDNDVTGLEKTFWSKTTAIDPWSIQISNHSTPSHDGNIVLCRATVQTDTKTPLISVSEWKPYVKGAIEIHDIDCMHDTVDDPELIAEIGGILCQRLHELHAFSSE